ncbi:interleukin-5 receptor subunit alpha-like isoform X3 [Pelodiscus sinensis]|uniref:interleukin-5 receptor subunit alpha-like isoform X3 n=1 Tax=Pelodiscus sinensis TaxID=13735 RepID=UPI003F6A8720
MLQLMHQACFCLALTWYKMISVCLANGHPSITASIMAPSDLHIVKNDFGVILSWNSNITEEMETYSVKYVLMCKFDTAKEILERLQENKRIIRLGLHSGFYAKVKTQLLSKETEDVIKESNWTEFVYKAPPVYIQNLSCIIYNLFNFNCTWDIKTEAPEDAQYFLSYRYSGKEFQCQLYLINAKHKNIGCHMKEVYFNSSNPIRLNINVRVRSNSSENRSYYKRFTPRRLGRSPPHFQPISQSRGQDCRQGTADRGVEEGEGEQSTEEKLNPPINVSLSLEDRSIKINWKPPPTIGSAEKNCFTYQVKITDLKPVDVSEEEYVHPVRDPEKQYIVQVRVKKIKCISNKIWSEWSEPIIINNNYKNNKMNTWQMLILVLFLSTIFTGGLLKFLCRRYKCIDTVVMPIPQPSERIRTWLELYSVQRKEYGLGPQPPDIPAIRDLSTPVKDFTQQKYISEIMLIPQEKNQHKRIN